MKRLVTRFTANEAQYTQHGSHYNETIARTDFITPFFRALGWDVDNVNGLSQDLREVFQEANLPAQEFKASKRPDYELRLARQKKFFVEAKKPSIDIGQDKQSAFQTRRYGFSAGLPVSVLTNFRQLAVYDCLPVPHENDDARIARLKLYSYREYESHFDEIYDALSREAVFSGNFDRRYGVAAARQGTTQFDDYFLKQIGRWREKLAKDIHRRNSGLNEEELTFIVQRILNRIIFLRICEDRDLEQYERLKSLDSATAYEDLKRLLRLADQKYDSGLFELVNDPSLGVAIGPQVLTEIVSDLYYPASPYTFAVVDASVLGQIYELLLAHTIRVSGSRVQLVEKPEVTESGGVVSTPKYIVDNIVQDTIGPLILNQNPEALVGLKIADIACGSGVFLLGAFEQLAARVLDYYVRDGVAAHNGREIYEAGPGTWRLTLHEKRRILSNCVFGVDIDHQAVEVARFSLILKLIEGETNESIATHLASHGERALPSLDQNVQCGNSLVDSDKFLAFNRGASDALLQTLNPFSWARAFPEIMDGGGFDAIIGNPPYIRIQNMVGYSPEEVQFYKSPQAAYQTAQSNNFDKYFLFIERALGLLKPQGRLGYIVPHKFTVITAGASLRKVLAEGKFLRSITHFGVQQVFEGQSTTYTCILVLQKSSGERFLVERVPDLATWRYRRIEEPIEHHCNELTEDPWAFIEGQAKVIIERLRQANPTTLETVADIFVGVQTSRDKIYIIKPTVSSRNTVRFEDVLGEEREIEKSILRPCLLDVSLEAFGKVAPNSFIIFPYEIVDGEAKLFEPEEMIRRFPLAWRYLNAHKASLKKRDIQNGSPTTWYRYGRSQSLTKFDSDKLIINILSLNPRYALDSDNIVVTGGGNGPYYLIRPRDGQPFSIYFLQALLNNPVLEAIIRNSSTAFRGGYYSHSKQFLKGLPVPHLDLSCSDGRRAHQDIVRLTKKLIAVNIRRSESRTPAKQELYKRISESLAAELNRLVVKSYGLSPEDAAVVAGGHS